MINLNHIRSLLLEIHQQQSSDNFYEKTGLTALDYPMDFRSWLATKNEAELMEISKKAIRSFPSIPAAKMLSACLSQNAITPGSRRKLIEELLLFSSFGNWIGKLELIDFLERIWDLKSIPSTDSRFSNASGDIWQHMVNNDDWSESYLLYDYLHLDTDTDLVFEKFCQELVHPLVRNDADEQVGYINILNKHLAKHNRKLALDDEMLGYSIYKCVAIHSVGVENKPKNLIFASIGPKPEIVLRDAINNDIQIVKNGEYCLIYDLPIGASGLTFQNLKDWWDRTPKQNPAQKLSDRLRKSLGSEPEKIIWDAYFQLIRDVSIDKLPALIPQVYLHYDPYTIRQLQGNSRLPRQRMDFLLLFSERDRVVIEVDGKQHYADEDKASPAKYSEMVAADRDLKLLGYEVFRFGGYELLNASSGGALAHDFFVRLLRKYGILPH